MLKWLYNFLVRPKMTYTFKVAGKMKRSVVYDMACKTTPLTNLKYYCIDITHRLNFMYTCDNYCYNIYDGFASSSAVKPSCRMPDFESNPDVFVITVEEIDLYFIIFSDVRRKNYYKGTSVEIGKVENVRNFKGDFKELTKQFNEFCASFHEEQTS